MGLARVEWRGGEKMQTTVIEEQLKNKENTNKLKEKSPKKSVLQ